MAKFKKLSNKYSSPHTHTHTKTRALRGYKYIYSHRYRNRYRYSYSSGGADKSSEMHSFWGFVARIHTNVAMETTRHHTSHIREYQLGDRQTQRQIVGWVDGQRDGRTTAA